jgi:integrase
VEHFLKQIVRFYQGFDKILLNLSGTFLQRFLRGKCTMKRHKGNVYFDEKRNSWYARITFTDLTGKRKDIKKKVENKSDGNDFLKKIINIYDNSGTKGIDSERLTFDALVDYYEEIYCKPPTYVKGKKVAGLRSFVSVKVYLKIFREYFGRTRLKVLTYDDIYKYRLNRLSTSTHQSNQRSIATVNRELAYLRRLLNIAERNSWIQRNPFKLGDSLISLSDEVKRERILTDAECQRLIDACTERRSHLKPIIIMALDTGCRLGEILKLQWKDVNFNSGIITIQAFNTKTMRERKLAITQRLNFELNNLLSSFPQDENDLVFCVKEVRQSFKTACKIAKLTNLRFHDLRHCHASKLDSLGFSIAAIGKQLGHTSDSRVTLRYINRNEESTRQVANVLDSFYLSQEVTSESSFSN